MILDRLCTLGTVVIVQLLLMLDVGGTPLGTVLTPAGVAALIGLNTVVLCAWVGWASSTDRIDTVVRTIGAIVIVATVSMWLVGWSNTAENASLACLGLILVATRMKRRRSAKVAVGPSLTP